MTAAVVNPKATGSTGIHSGLHLGEVDLLTACYFNKPFLPAAIKDERLSSRNTLPGCVVQHEVGYSPFHRLHS